MFQLKVFVGKLVPVNRHAARSIMIGKVSSLNHKSRNDPMETRPLIGKFGAPGMGRISAAQRFKVFHRLGNDIAV